METLENQGSSSNSKEIVANIYRKMYRASFSGNSITLETHKRKKLEIIIENLAEVFEEIFETKSTIDWDPIKKDGSIFYILTSDKGDVGFHCDSFPNKYKIRMTFSKKTEGARKYFEQIKKGSFKTKK